MYMCVIVWVILCCKYKTEEQWDFITLQLDHPVDALQTSLPCARDNKRLAGENEKKQTQIEKRKKKKKEKRNGKSSFGH